VNFNLNKEAYGDRPPSDAYHSVIQPSLHSETCKQPGDNKTMQQFNAAHS